MTVGVAKEILKLNLSRAPSKDRECMIKILAQMKEQFELKAAPRYKGNETMNHKLKDSKLTE